MRWPLVNLARLAILLVAWLPAALRAADESPRSGSAIPSASYSSRSSVRSLTSSFYRVPDKVQRYAERVVQQYDANHDGVLQADEWKNMQGEPEQIDANRDGLVTVDEYARYIARYGRVHRIHLVAPLPTAFVEVPPALFQPAAESTSAETEPESDADEEEDDTDDLDAILHSSTDRPTGKKLRSLQKFYIPRSKLPSGLPEWFVQRDLDGDGQLTMAEFAPSGGRLEMTEFMRMDVDHDGVITAKECLAAGKASKATSSSSSTSTSSSTTATKK